MKIHTMARIVRIKTILFLVYCYINLLDVFLLYSWVWNNRTGIIIEFALKSSLYYGYMRLCDYQFY